MAISPPTLYVQHKPPSRARQHLRRLYAFYNSSPLFTRSYAFFKVRNDRKIGIRPKLACWNYTFPMLWFSNLIVVCRHRRYHVFGRKWSRAKVAIKFLTREPSVHPQSNRNVLHTRIRILSVAILSAGTFQFSCRFKVRKINARDLTDTVMNLMEVSINILLPSFR